jgi:predicted nucleic acid-binding protein
LILVDTSGLLAALFPDQHQHEQCARVLKEKEGPFLLSPFVLAELDYLVAKLAGVDVELKLLNEVARGAYRLSPFDARDVEKAASIIARYTDLGIGLADASIVVLSQRFRVTELLTLDERHFRVLRGSNDLPFRLLPLDLQ